VRLLSLACELTVWVAVAGSALAFGAVHPFAYRPLWLVCLLAAALALARAFGLSALRRHVGRRRVALHSSGQWLMLNPGPGERGVGWACDLRRPLLPRGPLLLPGLAFLGWALLQLLPLPPGGRPVTLSPEATRLGMAFVAALLLLHQTAATFEDPAPRRRFRWMIAGLGLVLGLVALGQRAMGAQRIYGFFQPWEMDSFYGPFVNRNHFAGYMLLVVPVTLGLFAEAWRAHTRRVGPNPSLRQWLVSLSTPAGTTLLAAALPPLVTIAALFASTSRGAILAFVGALVLTAIGLRSRQGAPAWAAALVLVVMVLSWFGLERLEARFARVPQHAPGRTVIWRASLDRMEGPRWVTGYGFNTFAEAVSSGPAWRLPNGATPWPSGVSAVLTSDARVAFRSLGGTGGISAYREAHNDYVQLLVETGLPGLAIGLWGALAALAAARRDTWVFAALAGLLMHEFVDFDLQVPTAAALFVVLAAQPLLEGGGR
jgi:O-antigen ligase